MKLKDQKVLVLGPHPDDGEFGCGATIKKWTELGADVYYVVLSPCKKSVPEGFDVDVLYKELGQAAPELGIPEENVITFDFEVREFARDRQAILETFIQLRKQIKPEVVLLPNSRDIHQDHGTVHMEGMRAFKNATLLGYDLPWNYTELNVNYYEVIDESHLNAKIAALKKYKSQEFRSYADLEFFTGIARLRGVQCGQKLAEGFELLKFISK